MPEQKEQSAFIELCGLWPTKGGNLSGRSGKVRYIVVFNENKTKDSQPDGKLLLVQNDDWKKKRESEGQSQPRQQRQRSEDDDHYDPNQNSDEDDLPF